MGVLSSLNTANGSDNVIKDLAICALYMKYFSRDCED